MRPDRDAFASSRLLLRQGSLFGVVGGLQLAAEWACFVATTALGLAVVPANLFGRVAAAGLGFWLNGRYTFVAPGATAWSAAAAAASARSSKRRTTAFSFGFTSSMRARCACTTSTLDT